MKRILEALQALNESTNDQEVIVGDIDDEFDYESVNETEITPINFELKEPFNKYYKVVSVSEAAEAIGADEMDMLSASQINGYSVNHVAWLLAKPAYFNVLSYESYEVVEVVAEEGSEPFICSIVGGRIYNIENDILEAVNDMDASVDVNYIYLFPLDEEDLEVPFGRYEDALDYGLEILGVNRFQDELNLVVRGKKEDLEYFADDYLGGYQLHPDYLYVESDFAGDIESNQKMLDHDYWREQLKKHNDIIATINIDADNAYGDDPLEIIRNVAFLQPGFISPDSDSNYFSFTSEEEFEMQLSKVSKKEDESLSEDKDNVVTAEFYTNDFDLNDWKSGYPELMSRLVFDMSNSANKKDQFDVTRYTVTGVRKDVEEFIKLSIQDYACSTRKEAERLYGKGCIPTIIESLTEDKIDTTVTAEFYTDSLDLIEWREAYPELINKLSFKTSDVDKKKSQFDITRYTVTGSKEDIEEFIRLSIQDYGCSTKEEAEELYGKGCIPTIIESLKESFTLSAREEKILDDIADRFCVSYVNGKSYIKGYGTVTTDDDTTIIQRDMVARKLNCTKEKANEIMVSYFGYDKEELDESLNESFTYESEKEIQKAYAELIAARKKLHAEHREKVAEIEEQKTKIWEYKCKVEEEFDEAEEKISEQISEILGICRKNNWKYKAIEETLDTVEHDAGHINQQGIDAVKNHPAKYVIKKVLRNEYEILDYIDNNPVDNKYFDTQEAAENYRDSILHLLGSDNEDGTYFDFIIEDCLDESLNESSDAQKIIGFDTVNHVRKYYNEEKDEFVDNEADATIFTNYNLAQLTWFGLVDKKNPKKFKDQFDRIFIVIAK